MYPKKEDYEPFKRPFIVTGTIVEAGGTRFRVAMYESHLGIQYEFTEVGDKGIETFYRKPSVVMAGINEGRIKVVSTPI